MTVLLQIPPRGSGYTIAPLSPQTWSAFDALVQRHNGIFGGCWCIWFHPDGPERGQGAEANRALTKAYVEQGKAHAALVMDSDEAIAWADQPRPTMKAPSPTSTFGMIGGTSASWRRASAVF